MMIVVRPRIASARPVADLCLGGCVDGGGRVVEDQDARVDHERSCDREPLPLAARERDPALADHGVVAVRQLLDELVCLRGLRRPLDLLVRGVEDAERDVLADGGREEEGILGDDADLAPERAARDVADVDAVDEHAALGRVVEARHERGERRLARAGVADQRDRSSRARARGRSRAGPAGPRRSRSRRARSGSRPGRPASSTAPGRSSTPSGSSITSKIRSPDAVARCAWPTHIPRLRSGTISIASSRLKTKNPLQRERAADDHPAGGEQHGRLGEQRQEREQRHVDRALPERAHASRRRPLPTRARTAAWRRSSCANDLTTWTPTIDSSVDRRDVPELLLDVAQNRVRDVAVAVGDRDDQRRDRERDQREPPLDDEEHDHHGDDREDVLEEEDQAEAEEEANRLQVDGRARHQLAGLVAVVEAEREPEQVARRAPRACPSRSRAPAGRR